MVCGLVGIILFQFQSLGQWHILCSFENSLYGPRIPLYIDLALIGVDI